MSNAVNDALSTGASTSAGRVSIFGIVFGVLLTLGLGVLPLLTTLSQTYPQLVYLQIAAVVMGPLLTAYSVNQHVSAGTAKAVAILQQIATGLTPIALALVAKKLGTAAAVPVTSFPPVSTTAVTPIETPVVKVGGAP